MALHALTRLGLGPLFLMAGVAAQAGTVTLGEVAAPLWWPIDQATHNGPVSDRFTFSIAGDDPLWFSAFVSTGYSKYSHIGDLEGRLFRDDELLVTGDAQTLILDDPYGVPARQVTFEPVRLGGGDYELRFSGTSTSAWGDIGSGYRGQAEFEPSSPVPEPPSLALAGLGLAALLAAGLPAVRNSRRR